MTNGDRRDEDDDGDDVTTMMKTTRRTMEGNDSGELDMRVEQFD